MDQKANLSKLAADMLDWERRKLELDALEESIKATVLALKKTQTVGNVRAAFSNARKRYDYKTPGASAPVHIVESHTTPAILMPPQTDWRGVCKEAGLDVPFSMSGAPSVSLKLK